MLHTVAMVRPQLDLSVDYPLDDMWQSTQAQFRRAVMSLMPASIVDKGQRGESIATLISSSEGTIEASERRLKYPSAIAACKVHASKSATPDCRALYSHQHLQSTVAAPQIMMLMRERGKQREVEGVFDCGKEEVGGSKSLEFVGRLRAKVRLSLATHFISLLPNFCSNTTLPYFP